MKMRTSAGIGCELVRTLVLSRREANLLIQELASQIEHGPLGQVHFTLEPATKHERASSLSLKVAKR